MNDAAVMAGLVRDLGPELGPRVYEDFRNRDNLDGPMHTTKRFPYLQVPETVDWSAHPENPTAQVSAADAAELAELAESSRIKYERLKLSIAARRDRPVAERRHVEPPRDRRAPRRRAASRC